MGALRAERGGAIGSQLDDAGDPRPRIGEGMDAGELNLIASCAELNLAVLKIAGGMAEARAEIQVGRAVIDPEL